MRAMSASSHAGRSADSLEPVERPSPRGSLAKYLYAVPAAAGRIQLDEEDMLAVAERNLPPMNRDALGGLAHEGVHDVSRRVGRLLFDEVLGSYGEVVVCVVVAVGRNRIHGRLEDVEHACSRRRDEHGARGVRREDQDVAGLDPRGAHRLDYLLCDVEGIEAAPGLGLELLEDDHEAIVTHAGCQWIGQALGHSEQTFKGARRVGRMEKWVEVFDPRNDKEAP